VLLRGRYADILRAVAQRIPDGVSVVDVCCGTCRLYRKFLREKSCAYLGLDVNPRFVRTAARRGIPARCFDALAEDIPPHDVVVMCSSFYHFYAEADEVFEKMRRAARKAVIISEPVRNLSTHPVKWVARLAGALTDPGVGDSRRRYDLEGFRAFARRHGADEFIGKEGDRQALAVFEV
jgi:SAM-dependent methyltransferase